MPSPDPALRYLAAPGRRLRRRRRRDIRVHSSEPGSTVRIPPSVRPAWTLIAGAPPGGTLGVPVGEVVPVGVVELVGVLEFVGVGGPPVGKVRVGVGVTLGDGKGPLPCLCPGGGVGQPKRNLQTGFFGFFLGSGVTWTHFSPLNTADWKFCTGSFENSISANVCHIRAGHAPPKPPPPKPYSDCDVLAAFCDWVKIPTASVYCGIAPMKNAEWEFVVVPVLPMICRPSVIAAAVPVPSTVVISIPYWTCESSGALSTTASVTFAGTTGPPGTWYDCTMWAEWYVPLLEIVDSIVACSLTVSEAVPRARLT